MTEENDSGNGVLATVVAFAEKGTLKYESGNTSEYHLRKMCPSKPPKTWSGALADITSKKFPYKATELVKLINPTGMY
jgi:hypothetical protein